MNDGIIVLITASTGDEAARIGRALVDEHLAACVNMISPVRSFFFWQGKTQEATGGTDGVQEQEALDGKTGPSG